MTDSITVKIEGIKELQSKFKLIENDIQEILSQSVSQGAAVVEREAKQIVHVDTGRLRNSIREIKTESSATRAESQVGTDVEYGTDVEFRYPYLRPAIDNNEAEITDAVERSIKSRLSGYR